MEKKALKIGIVGLGWGYKYHIKRVNEVPNAKVTAIADTNEELLHQVSTEHDIKETYADAFKLFENADVDGVIIAVPNFLHKEFAIKALESGKHVCLEKPIAPSVAEAMEIIAARDKTKQIFMANFNQRFEGNILPIKEVIQTGGIGKILYGQTKWIRRRGIPWGTSDWFVIKDKSGGGPLIDIGVHRLDLALFLMGFPKVKSVEGNVFYGQGSNLASKTGRKYTVEDAAIGYIQFENNTSLVLEASWYLNCPDTKMETVLYAEKGGVVVHAAREGGQLNMAVNDIYMDCSILDSDRDRPMHNIDHFCRVMRGEDELLCTAEQAVEGLKILKSIYESAEKGKVIYFED